MARGSSGTGVAGAPAFLIAISEAASQIATMVRAADKAKTRKPGSGRKPFLAASVAGVDAVKLKALIDRHQGVVLRMVDDLEGLRGCGLETDRPLSRVTLGSRLAAIKLAGTTALVYANEVRVKAGKPGPRRTPEAKRTAEEVAAERTKLVDALARSATKENAARMFGLSTRRSLNKLVEELGVTEADIDRRRRDIATCAGCRTETQAHSCGA